MNKFLFIICLLCCTNAMAATNCIKVQLNYNWEDFFPTFIKKHNAYYQARASQIKPHDRAAVLKSIRLFKSAYPQKIICSALKEIRVAKRLSYHGLVYGGTYYKNIIFLRYDSKDDDITTATKMLHHEFASILLKKYFLRFPWHTFERISSKNYSSKNGGLDLLSDSINDSSHSGYWKEGFLTKYGASSIDNDMSVYAEHLFVMPQKLQRLKKKYPIIKKKTALIIGFYCSLSKSFSFCDKRP